MPIGFDGFHDAGQKPILARLLRLALVRPTVLALVERERVRLDAKRRRVTGGGVPRNFEGWLQVELMDALETQGFEPGQLPYRHTQCVQPPLRGSKRRAKGLWPDFSFKVGDLIVHWELKTQLTSRQELQDDLTIVRDLNKPNHHGIAEGFGFFVLVATCVPGSEKRFDALVKQRQRELQLADENVSRRDDWLAVFVE